MKFVFWYEELKTIALNTIGLNIDDYETLPYYHWFNERIKAEEAFEMFINELEVRFGFDFDAILEEFQNGQSRG